MIALQTLASIVRNCDPGSTDPSCQTNLPNVTASSSNLQLALQIIFGVIAAVTVIYIIVAAIRYQISLGNPEATAKLRNTLIYAAIGLVIAMAAEAIVTFTLGKL